MKETVCGFASLCRCFVSFCVHFVSLRSCFYVSLWSFVYSESLLPISIRFDTPVVDMLRERSFEIQSDSPCHTDLLYLKYKINVTKKHENIKFFFLFKPSPIQM